jgi:hypothetical protein
MEEVNRVVNAILRSPQIKNKIVVLVEGDLPPPEPRRLSPQEYAKYERLPDANFYKACVPRNWQHFRTPVFFNCGGRAEVLHAYETLQIKHARAPRDSYLSPEKLYALVDLDIQIKETPDGYRWRNTEAIHEDLYVDGLLKNAINDEHRIWVTALVHKEAFFVMPGISDCLLDGVRPFWNDKPLDIREVHAELARTLSQVKDISENFDTVKTRMSRYSAGTRLACTDAACLGQSWLDQAQSANGDDYEALARALLSVAKAKTIWEQIRPEPACDQRPENFRDDLALKIGAVISILEPSAHPLAGFFGWLEPRR